MQRISPSTPKSAFCFSPAVAGARPGRRWNWKGWRKGESLRTRQLGTKNRAREEKNERKKTDEDRTLQQQAVWKVTWTCRSSLWIRFENLQQNATNCACIATIVTRTLLVAPGITTSNKKLLVTRHIATPVPNPHLAPRNVHQTNCACGEETTTSTTSAATTITLLARLMFVHSSSFLTLPLHSLFFVDAATAQATAYFFVVSLFLSI